MSASERSSSRTQQCCGAVKKDGRWVRCPKSKMRHRLPPTVLIGGPMEEGTLCNTCYRFAMRCSQREKQKHAKCCDGPTAPHRARLEAFTMPAGVTFNFLDGAPRGEASHDHFEEDSHHNFSDTNDMLGLGFSLARWHSTPSALPMRRVQSDLGAGATGAGARPAPSTTRSYSALTAGRAPSPTASAQRLGYAGVQTNDLRSPRPRCYSYGYGPGESPRDAKRPRKTSSSHVKSERPSAPNSSWASSVGSTASEGGSFVAPNSSSSSPRFSGPPAASESAVPSSDMSDVFSASGALPSDSEDEDDFSFALLSMIASVPLPTGSKNSGSTFGAPHQSLSHPALPRPVVSVPAAVGHFAPAAAPMPVVGTSEDHGHYGATEQPAARVFITTAEVPDGQTGSSISNIMSVGGNDDSTNLFGSDDAMASPVVGAPQPLSQGPAIEDDVEMDGMLAWMMDVDSSSGSC